MDEEKYYVYINDGVIDGCGQCLCEEVECLEVSEELFNQFCDAPECFDYIDGSVVLNQDKVSQKEQSDYIAQAKEQRTEAVERITVEVDGMTFDGDETSQDRMARTISIATANGLPMTTETQWVLADNTIATVTLSQLATACLLAGQRQTELWMTPYNSNGEE